MGWVHTRSCLPSRHHTKACLTNSTLMITLAAFFICLFLSLALQDYHYYNRKEMSSCCLGSLYTQNLPELSSQSLSYCFLKASHGVPQPKPDFIPCPLFIHTSRTTSLASVDMPHTLPPQPSHQTLPMLENSIPEFMIKFLQGFSKMLSRTFRNDYL